MHKPRRKHAPKHARPAKPLPMWIEGITQVIAAGREMTAAQRAQLADLAADSAR